MKRYYYGKHEHQFADLYKPQNESKISSVVCVIHGGYWKDNHDLNTYATTSIVEYLLAQGVAVWNIEYRRMQSTGDNTNAPWPSILQDVGCAIDYLAKVAATENLVIDPLGVIGHSAGGHLALWAASRLNVTSDSPLYKADALAVKSVLSIAGVVELRSPEDLDQPEQIQKLIGGSEQELKNCYAASNPAELIPNDVKIRLMHGTADPTVSVDQALRYERLAKDKAEVTIVEGADHFSMLPHDGDWDELHWLTVTSLITKLLVDIEVSVS
jgi:acetyl esterase/lipase